MIYRAICRVSERGNRNDLVRLKDIEGNSANSVIAKVQKIYGDDPNFVAGYLYTETDSDYEPIAELDVDQQTGEIFVTEFEGSGNSSYRKAVVTYLTWEDMRGWGD